jgi:cytochrome c553
MKRIFFLALALVASTAASAGNPQAGKQRAVTCAACHGANGISNNPLWPNLRGQKEQYLIKQLKAFRSGQRNDPVMSPMARPLSDSDIENIAAYYSQL